MSILIATVAIPIRAAGEPGSHRGLKRAVLGMVVFNTLYMLACAFVYHRLP